LIDSAMGPNHPVLSQMPGRRTFGFLSRVLSLATLIPLLMVAVADNGYTAAVCRLTGMVRLTDCCPSPDGAPRQAPTQQSLTERSCCDLVSVPCEKPPAESATPIAQASELAGAPVFTRNVSPAVPVRRLSPRPAHRAAVGPPPLLMKQSFLI
jgi:hypothetical protein